MEKVIHISKSKHLRLMAGVGLILAGSITGTVQAEQAARIGAAKIVAEKALPAIISNLNKLANEKPTAPNCAQRHELIKKYAQIAGDADMPPLSQKELQSHFFKGCMDEKSTTPPPSRPARPAPVKSGVPESKSTWQSAQPRKGKSGAETASPPRPIAKTPSARKETEKALENVASEAQKATEALKVTQAEGSETAKIRQSQKGPKPLPTPKRSRNVKAFDGPPEDMPPLPPTNLPPLPPSPPSGLLGKKPTPPNDSETTATKSGSQKSDLPPPQEGRGSLLSDLQNANPQARLKRNAPVQPPKPAEQKEGLQEVLQGALAKQRGGVIGKISQKDQATLDDLLSKGKTHQEIRQMAEDFGSPFDNDADVLEKLDELEKK